MEGGFVQSEKRHFLAGIMSTEQRAEDNSLRPKGVDYAVSDLAELKASLDLAAG